MSLKRIDLVKEKDERFGIWDRLKFAAWNVQGLGQNKEEK